MILLTNFLLIFKSLIKPCISLTIVNGRLVKEKCVYSSRFIISSQMLNRMDFKDKFSKHFKIVIKFKKCILRILGSRILKLSTQISWHHSILDWKSLVKVFCPITYPINRFILGQIVIAVYIGRMKFRDLNKAQQVQCYIVTCRSLDTQA